MKLFVQIPCYNEEHTLPLVVRSIPRSIPGVDEVRILIIDDGSSDRTTQVARELGVDYIVSHPVNQGLAAAFRTGLDTCLQLGADIIVNTDGDNQYPQQDIPRLIQPILDGQADMVVADRQVANIREFPQLKRLLQSLGSWTVRRFSGARVADAPSGFRAFSRRVAERFYVLSSYSYTLETLIQAGRSRMTIVNVPITTNAKTRESRLIRGIPSYVAQSAGTILRSYALYEPLKTFVAIGSGVMIVGLGLVAHWAYFRYFQPAVEDKLQSVVLGAALMVIGFQVWMMGLLANLIGVNRWLLEQVLYRVKQIGSAESRSGVQAVAPQREASDERAEASLAR